MKGWSLVYDAWDPRAQPRREALCALGNGLFVTRGAAEEARAGAHHYPGTYIAGGYDRADSRVADRTIENEDLVNWPNWLPLTFRPKDGPWLDLDSVTILSFRQVLDLRCGVLRRRVRFQDASDRRWRLETERLVHMQSPHHAAIRWELTSETWSGTVQVRSGLDGTVTNDGVERYRDLEGRHLDVLAAERAGEQGVSLLVQSRQSQIRVALSARTTIQQDGADADLERRLIDTGDGFIGHELALEVEAGKPIRIEKIVALYTSRDAATSEPLHEARRDVDLTPDFEALLASHVRAWSELWHRGDVSISSSDGDWPQLVLRLHVFHLLQTVSMNTIDRDAGVPSRGLHGEAYRGHIFWDELFIFPFLTLRLPELTRALLMYRYRRLGEARRAARAEGLAGAMFPWQSGSNGREESQRIHLNPRSGRWLPDASRLQRHVGAAIAWNLWRYFQVTGDMEFLSCYGAEMILEIARFWASLASYNAQRERYEICGVMGPDEYHEAYPDASEPGLNNNAYTNVMAAWTLRTALRVLELLPPDRHDEIVERLGLTDEETVRFEQVSRRLFVPLRADGIIEQFEGFERLEELDWDGLRSRHDDIRRLDRVLEAEGTTVDRYKAGKQADVLMLFYLFSAEELQALLRSLGYELEREWITRNVEYYSRRTSHGSTLSRMTHSWVLARSDRKASWQYFESSLHSDIDDAQGGTTPEGIHLGAMAGTVDIVQRCYTGLETEDEILWLNPRLPDRLERLHLRIRYRGHWLTLAVDRQELTVTLDPSTSPPVRIGFQGEVYDLCQGESRTLILPREGEPSSARAADAKTPPPAEMLRQ